MAAYEGLKYFIPTSTNECPVLAVDNTTAYFSILNGRSPCPLANQIVGSIRTNWNLWMIWIPSEIMPADGPSRSTDDPLISEKANLVAMHADQRVFLPRLYWLGWITLGVFSAYALAKKDLSSYSGLSKWTFVIPSLPVELNLLTQNQNCPIQIAPANR